MKTVTLPPVASHNRAVISRIARRVVTAGLALTRINESSLEKLVVTNTILLNEKAAMEGKITVLSVAELFGEAIKRIHEGSSVSSLFI